MNKRQGQRAKQIEERCKEYAKQIPTPGFLSLEAKDAGKWKRALGSMPRLSDGSVELLHKGAESNATRAARAYAAACVRDFAGWIQEKAGGAIGTIHRVTKDKSVIDNEACNEDGASTTMLEYMDTKAKAWTSL